MTRWFRSYWAEEDTWFYIEAGADGWVTRQVELQGPLEKPIAAASLTEWEAAHQTATHEAYEATFGATAEVPIQEWDDRNRQELTADEFETVWITARTARQARDGA